MPPTRRTITLLTDNTALRNMVRECVSPALLDDDYDITDRPTHADAVVTTAKLSGELERFAAKLGCYPIVLPEGGDYLAAKVADGSMSTLVGSDMVKVRLR